jgi:hypothetical protein
MEPGRSSSLACRDRLADPSVVKAIGLNAD